MSEQDQTAVAAAPVTAPRIHAVTMDSLSGLAETKSFRTKKELAKEMSAQPNLKVLAVFKGKKLAITEKVSINFC